MKPTLLYYLPLIICQFYGSAEKLGKRILGGRNGKQGQFPFIASLKIIGTDRHHCGASIISTRVLLTAAHCLCDYIPCNKMYATAGSIFTDEMSTRYTLQKCLCHEKWKLDVEINQSTNDIALALLEQTIKYTANIKPIKLSNINVPTSARVIILGYGCISLQNLNPYYRLQYAFMDIISQRACKKHYSYIDQRDMCAHRNYSKPDKGGCYADSGSPVVFKNKQVGVLYNIDENVPRSRPDLIVRVSKYLSWIKTNVKKMMHT